MHAKISGWQDVGDRYSQSRRIFFRIRSRKVGSQSRSRDDRLQPHRHYDQIGGDDINLGKIYLNEGKLLQEVVVSGDRMVESKGRTIIYPSIADVKASSTSLSLFLKLPLAGLDANPINRTLSVDGGTPMILINGVPSSMDDVNSIQAKEIEKIEYSRITPARYADQGKRGMISITLKKRNDGGSVYLWGRSATATAFMDGNFRASYHQAFAV